MQRVILVVSPDTEFLQQLRSHLEEGGRYQVTAALSAHEALNLANSNFFEVAIVDGELDDIPVAAFTRDLSALQSDLKILVFPPDNNSQHPVLEGLVANGFLSKPFSGQEIGRALSNLFSDSPAAGNVQVKVIDDLVKQWLQIPETGGRKAEQILKASTAQTVFIIIKDLIIASSGAVDEGLEKNITGFLTRYWKDEENSELARFIRPDGDGSERFLYATKLVSNAVLVMVYPAKSTIQLVRRELNAVKDDFQQHYPTTGELRQDIAKQALADINERNKKLESLQTNAKAFSQNDLDVLDVLQQQTASSNGNASAQTEVDARKLFEQESLKLKPISDEDVSQAELDALGLVDEPNTQTATETESSAELAARRLFEQESQKSRPTPAINAISQAEIDLLRALEQEPQPTTNDAALQAELEARRLFEQESQKSKPKPAMNGITQEEIDLLKALQQEPQPAAESAASQAELEARKLFEQESQKPKPAINGITQEEIDLLKALQQQPQPAAAEAVSQAELEARKLFEQESLKSKPQPEIKTISQDEIDLLKALQQEPQPAAADAVSQAELEARKLFEQESQKPKPAINGITQEEIDLLKALQQAPVPAPLDEASQAELEARKLFEQESLKSKPKPEINGISQAELDALNTLQQTSTKPTDPGISEAELEALQILEQGMAKQAPVSAPGISEQELTDLAKMLEQMPAPDPVAGGENVLEEKKLPEWLNELETNENAGQSVSTSPEPAAETIPAGTPPFVGIDPSLQTPTGLDPLPEIDFKLPWEIEESTPETTPVSTNEPVLTPVLEQVTPEVAAAVQPVAESAVETVPATPPSFAEVLTSVAPQAEISPAPVEVETPTPVAVEPAVVEIQAVPAAVEPSVAETSTAALVEEIITAEEPTPPPPPTLKEFRFNYTLVLMPSDHNQFLTRNLSEKISTIMPDIHEDQGWHMTSITLRPQYLLWTVAVPLGTCPQRIMQEVRQLTSNSIFANFPEIAKVKTSNDFWSSKFLAVSGSEPPPANLIFDFVSDAWKTPEPAAS